MSYRIVMVVLCLTMVRLVQCARKQANAHSILHNLYLTYKLQAGIIEIKKGAESCERAEEN